MTAQSLPGDHDPVRPAYGSGSLTELLPSIAVAQGAHQHGWSNHLGLPDGRRWVVLLVDGLGWHNLHAEAAAAPFLAQQLRSADSSNMLTAAVPSTTTTSLTSLGTGTPPGQHGMVGYSFRLPGAKGAVLNALTWHLPHSPRTVQPVATVLERLESETVVTTVSLQRFAGSGLTEAALRGGAFVGLTDETDQNARRDAVVAAATAGERSLVYAYERRLDMYGHASGWQSEIWRAQLSEVDRLTEQLRSALPPEVTLVVTADHGMVDVAQERMIIIEDHPQLAAGLDCIAGEGRFRQLYSDREDAHVLAARWAGFLGERAWVRTRDEAIEAGWFGPVAEAVRGRIGDVVVAMREDWAVMTRTLRQELGLVGMHGSLTPIEMQVPLLVFPG